jgi:hypothetical protein
VFIWRRRKRAIPVLPEKMKRSRDDDALQK